MSSKDKVCAADRRTRQLMQHLTAAVQQPPAASPFRNVLIANRGEIALRIAGAAATLGIKTTAVYASPSDDQALHRQYCDAALPIAAGVVGYLDANGLVAAAVRAGCDCVHPGYGFLSETAHFASRCQEAGLVFIGPSAHCLALFGDKVEARNLASSLSVPVLPGSSTACSDAAQACEAAVVAGGYPVMLKACGGGGGKGMRECSSAAQMAESFASSAREADAAFGQASVFVEKLVS